jgi:hypothetical protein
MHPEIWAQISVSSKADFVLKLKKKLIYWTIFAGYSYFEQYAYCALNVILVF